MIGRSSLLAKLQGRRHVRRKIRSKRRNGEVKQEDKYLDLGREMSGESIWWMKMRCV